MGSIKIKRLMSMPAMFQLHLLTSLQALRLSDDLHPSSYLATDSKRNSCDRRLCERQHQTWKYWLVGPVLIIGATSASTLVVHMYQGIRDPILSWHLVQTAHPDRFTRHVARLHG